MRSSKRKKRLQRKQRLEQFGADNDKESSPVPESPQSTSSTSPYPYHQHIKAPPPTYTNLENRAASENSLVSEMTMEDFGGAHESVLEYSDTSDDNRYFMPPSNNMVRDNRGRKVDSGESAFRDLRATGSQSSRVVDFSSDRPAFPFDDEGSNPQANSALLHPRPSQPMISNWMTNLAYSFRSQNQSGTKTAGKKNTHRQQPSSSIMEYPYTTMVHPFSSSLASAEGSLWETSPLIQAGIQQGNGIYAGDYATVGHPLKEQTNGKHDPAKEDQKPKQTFLKSKKSAATIAAFFLMDYEAGRPPTLSSDFESITSSQLKIYQFHFSWAWRNLGVNIAILILFLAHTQNYLTTAMMHTYAVMLFFVDIWMREELHGKSEAGTHSERRLIRPLVLFLIVLAFESWIWCILYDDPDRDENQITVSALFKPLVFFYVSKKARNALEALLRIGRIVTRVLVIEMFLILTFAAVACQMFRGYNAFENLTTSWVSLFELSTTVVNPSLWMPMYSMSRSSAIFFVFFIVVSVFYLHSLVLSVVFQTYIQAATDIHERSVADGEEAVRMAFLALRRDDRSESVSTASVRKALQIMRPHYSTMKIKALMDIVNPSNQNAIDFPTFRNKIRQALNASIRTARSTTSFAMGVELIAVLVAVVNFLYVILLTSNFQADWFDAVAISAGSAITLLGLLELVIRFNPLRVPNFAPITRLNGTFDGLALLAALVSCAGIVQVATDLQSATDYLFMGRAIDMIRIMRFFQIFRDVVRRSADVVPAMAGPFILVLSILHVFVYFGISLWGGAVDVEVMAQNENITSLYYLNNFNSYTEGLITMFNVLVVNDWHEIAKVFLYADRCSSPYLVYPFFIAGICFGVFIMVNVITAFFVESFVTKLGDVSGRRGNNEHSSRVSENGNEKRRLSASLKDLSEPVDQEPVLEADNNSSSSSKSTEIFAFDVYERGGFDQIMRTVAGASDQAQEAFARSICSYLEVFESLAEGREKVGYMVCCQQSLNRFGNRRFQNNSRDYVKDEVLLHKIVSDMHSELLVLTSRRTFEDRCLVRRFTHKTDPSLRLEITASLLRHQPAVSLLVSRIKRVSHSDP